MPENPFPEFIRAVKRLAKSGGEGQRVAGLYLSKFTKRRAVAAEAQAKTAILDALAPAVRVAERTIVFANTRNAAANAAKLFLRAGIKSAVLDSEMDMDERRSVFVGFEQGETDLVAAPRLLDEGIDVPAADLGLIVASSRSKRQMIQRMGRVLRRKEDGRLARVVILYVAGTSEDPDRGAHEDFVDEVREAADHVEVFSPRSSTRAIVSYLNSFAGR